MFLISCKVYLFSLIIGAKVLYTLFLSLYPKKCFKCIYIYCLLMKLKKIIFITRLFNVYTSGCRVFN